MTTDAKHALESWKSIVPLVRGLIDGLGADELDRRLETRSTMSVRETVHHVVEANVVAASIVVAALGSPGSVYDWSWMMPFGPWQERMRYDRKSLGPALLLLEALNAWVAAQIEPLADGLARTVRLRDQPGGELRSATVAEVLLQEVEHARGHVEEIVGLRERG